MGRTFDVAVLLNADEFLALKHAAEDTGVSMSCYLRMAVKEKISVHAANLHAQSRLDTAEVTHVQGIDKLANARTGGE